MSYQENFWVLFSKKLSNEATTDELKELENLIKDHPEWQYAIQNLEDLWKHRPVKDYSHEDDSYMLHIHRMKELGVPFGEMPDSQMPAKEKKKKMLWYSIAAAAMVIAGFFLFGSFSGKNKINKNEIVRQVNEISTRPGSKSKVELPDGSIVWLNAGSKLTYNKDFGKEKREVTLVGEGFFDVTKNKEKPFIISTSSINIKVLGTVFNVKAYTEDKQTETSLLHGSIEVTIKNRPNDKIILSPSEKLIVENQIESVSTNGFKKNKENITRTAIPDISTLVSINKLTYNPDDSTVAEAQWINNKLIFRDETFSDLAVQMERWYNVNIEIKNEKVAQERLNGTLETETITQALDALQETTSFRYEKTGNKVIIH
ncbi:MAG: FecR family protein [Chitinophagaceae bacterium]